MSRYTVLVTGIGGNVGQGILRNIRAIDSSIRVIGTNIAEFSAGNHLCDKVYKIPYSYEKGFKEEMIRISELEKINLIIPSTDYECLYLSSFKEEIPKVATSSFETNRIFTDKYLTFENFNRKGIPFAHSMLPSEYDNRFEEIILKPRQGRGSRGILINPKDISTYSDQEYMIQELCHGIEITTAFYVTKNNIVHGHITMERKLENGTTVLCLVTSLYDQKIIPIIKKMQENFKITGSCNIQSIVTKEGNIVPFEINGRISGTNSIRSNFGFEDVKYTLEEWLFDVEPSTVNVRSGAATRILMDVIYPDVKDWNQLNSANSETFIF